MQYCYIHRVLVVKFRQETGIHMQYVLIWKQFYREENKHFIGAPRSFIILHHLVRASSHRNSIRNNEIRFEKF